MKLYLIRHGETDYNKKKKNQGRTDIPLNEYGRELARKTAEGMAEISFDQCFCSPLKRARETAELILGNRDVQVQIDDRLIEISFGIYEGRCWDPASWDEEMPRDFQCFFDEPGRYQAPENGESLEALKERTGAFFQELCAREDCQDSTILISTHGAALSAILANIKNLPIDQFWGEGCSRNCGVTIVEVQDGQATILEENHIYY